MTFQYPPPIFLLEGFFFPFKKRLLLGVSCILLAVSGEQCNFLESIFVTDISWGIEEDEGTSRRISAKYKNQRKGGRGEEIKGVKKKSPSNCEAK